MKCGVEAKKKKAVRLVSSPFPPRTRLCSACIAASPHRSAETATSRWVLPRRCFSVCACGSAARPLFGEAGAHIFSLGVVSLSRDRKITLLPDRVLSTYRGATKLIRRFSHLCPQVPDVEKPDLQESTRRIYFSAPRRRFFGSLLSPVDVGVLCAQYSPPACPSHPPPSPPRSSHTQCPPSASRSASA